MVTIHAMENNQYCESAQFEFAGLSTDTKPTEIEGFPVGENSLFLELDTNKFYYFDGTDWTEVGQAPSGDE